MNQAFESFLKNFQRKRDFLVIKELIANALENDYTFEGYSDEDIVNDILTYADDVVSKYVGSVEDPVTKTRLLLAVSQLRIDKVI